MKMQFRECSRESSEEKNQSLSETKINHVIA